MVLASPWGGGGELSDGLVSHLCGHQGGTGC